MVIGNKRGAVAIFNMLDVTRLTHSYADVPLFEPVSFDLNPHQAIQLMGPNGSGKSTLLRSIGGLLPPRPGAVLWKGVDVRRDAPAFQRSLVYVGHENALLPHWDVLSTVRMWAQLYGAENQQIDHALDQLDLRSEAHTPIEHLSAGQKRRLSLTRLSLTDRPLWLLDEPTASLDEYSQHVINVLVTQFLESGGMVVATSHHALPWPDSTRITLQPFAGWREAA